MDYRQFLEYTYGMKVNEIAEAKVVLPEALLEHLKEDFDPGEDTLSFEEHLGDLIIYGLMRYNQDLVKNYFFK